MSKTNESPAKKEKKINFSTTDYLKNKIKIGDKSASVVGYIEEIIPEETFLKKKDNVEFKILKFIINNNDGIRIQCNVYDDNIPKFISQIKLNEKILLETVSVLEATKYTKGNLNYELILRYYSSIFLIGEVDRMKNLKPIKITFKDIALKKGFIKIQGYLRNSFVRINERKEQEYFGAITDGHYKLEVLLKKENDTIIQIERGSKLEIIGDIQENGKSFILKVNDIDYIKVLKEEKMELEELILGSEIFLIQDLNKEEEQIKA